MKFGRPHGVSKYKISHENLFKENLEWMATGKVGCTFAAFFARNPDLCDWGYEVITEQWHQWKPERACSSVMSLIFPGWSREDVRLWASMNGFVEVNVNGYKHPAKANKIFNMNQGKFIGLRYATEWGESWVQYFGSDSHVATRHTPHPMLMLSIRPGVVTYAKVGFKNILHLAHASVYKIRQVIADRMWETSHSNTEKQLGHKPTLKEVAKTTFYYE